MKSSASEAEGDAGLLRDHRVPVARLEQREHRPPAVGGDLEWPALEALRPEVEPLDGLEPEVLGVPPRRRFPVRHADVHVVEPAHSKFRFAHCGTLAFANRNTS